MRYLNRFTLAVVFSTGTLTVMAGAIIAPVLNVMRAGLGVDPARAGLIITTHSIFIAVLSPFVGVAIDRVGIRRLFILALVVYAAAGGSGLVIDSFWPLVASRAVLGLAASVLFISNTVLILNVFSGDRRNQVMGWRGSANALGAVAWPLVGGALGSVSWHLPFAVYLVGLPLAGVALFTIPEAHYQEAENQAEKDSVLEIFRSAPVLVAIYGLIFLSSLLLYSLVVFGPPLLEGIGITSPFGIGLFIAVMGAASGLTSFRYGRIKRRLSYRRLILLSLALWTAGFLTLGRTGNTALIAVSLALFGIGQGMVSPACMVWVGEVSPMAFRGRISSLLGTFGFIGQFAAPVFFAPVVLRAGPQGVFTAAGAVCMALLVVLAAARSRYRS
ncbi:MAG: MFS transporter [Candidatus Glassbacteria bacterium]